ncbi:hypothetical protein B9Z55_019526 [Caenorhabditis nigoni]|uniref:Uncharacterized protein n=1 Tax=Caenorhabditis nigoni TaxID=1611254 RepID=A0A2G5TIS8_9PELO|nr:hypothetical protein B9Z55_019526 [Caenorhabditis nigoni]
MGEGAKVGVEYDERRRRAELTRRQVLVLFESTTGHAVVRIKKLKMETNEKSVRCTTTCISPEKKKKDIGGSNRFRTATNTLRQHMRRAELTSFGIE